MIRLMSAVNALAQRLTRSVKSGRPVVAASKNDPRRSTRLSLRIPVMVTHLDPTSDFREQCETVVINAHGCGVIVHKKLEHETPVLVELVSTGASKKAHVVAAVPTLEATAWLLGLEFDSPEKNFWKIEHPPADWERLAGMAFHEKLW
jgi:hypothetical protein